jgi:hypothetical protein
VAKKFELDIDITGDSSILDEYVQKLREIKKISDEMKGKVNLVDDRDVDKLKELVAQQESLAAAHARLKIKAEEAKAAAEKKAIVEERAAREQLGLIGSLVAKQKELQSALKSATSVEEVKRLNKEIGHTKTKIDEFKNAGKEATNTFGHALQSFQFKFNALGQTIGELAVHGIETLAEGVQDFAKESVEAFLHAELTVKQLEVALSNISGEGDGALTRLLEQSHELQEVSIFPAVEIQKAQTMLVQYGLTSEEVEKLTPKIIDLASAQGIDLASATEKSIQAINGQTKGLKTAGIAFSDTGTKAGNLAKLTENLNKFQGQSAAILDTNEGKLKVLGNAYDDVKETVGEFIVTGAEPLLDILKFVANGFQIAGDEVDGFSDSIKLSDKELEKLNSTMLNFAINSQKSLIERLEQAGGDGGSIAKATEQLKNLNAQLFGAGAKGLSDSEIEKQIKELEGASTKMQLLAKGDLSNAEKIAILKGNLDVKSKLDEATTDKKAGAEKVKRTKDLEREIRDIRLAQEDSYRQEREKIFNAASDRIEDLEKDTTIKSEEQRAALILEIRKKLQADLEKLNLKTIDNNSAFKKKEAEEIKTNGEEELAEKLRETKVLEDRRLEKEEKEKEARKKQFDSAIDDSQKLADALSTAAKEQSDREIAGIDKQIEAQKNSLQIQQERAEKGLNNTLELEQKKAADLEIERQKALEKEKHRQQLIAFYNLFASYAKDDAKTALPNALKDVAAAKIAEALFAEDGGIIGDIKTMAMLGSGALRSHGAGYDTLVMADKREGILSVDEIQALGGKDGFNELRENIKKGNLYEQVPVFAPIHSAHSNANVIKAIKSLEKTIANQPKYITKLDNLGNILTEYTTETLKHTRKIMQNPPPFRR